ncbi:MAG: tyrosine-type recombinase/integrase, partial [Vagococcus sp.]
EALEIIEEMFPQAHGELNWETPFQLLIATILSAQATDKGVNKATPALFAAYPDAETMAEASVEDIEQKIRTIGLYNTHILPQISNLPLYKFTVDKCQELTNMWFNKYKTYKRLVNLMNQIFEYAIKKQIIVSNPVSFVDLPVKRTDENERNVYSFEELSYFLDVLGVVASQKQEMYFTLVAETGLRKSEALALTWNDIDFKNETLIVNKSVSKDSENNLVLETPKTKSSYRRIYITNSTLTRLLQSWKLKQQELLTYYNVTITDESQLLFTTNYNKIHQPSAPNEWLESIYRKHDKLIEELQTSTPSKKAFKLKDVIETHSLALKPIKRLTIHEFRHTHCTLLFEVGVGPADVKQRLGHSSIKTTLEVYDHPNKTRATQTALSYYDHKKSQN